MVNSYIAFYAGIALLILAGMVMKAYWPSFKKGWCGESILGMAIFLGFFAAAINTAFWQIGVGVFVESGLVERATYREIGLYLDGVFKGTAALAAFLHLLALQKFLPKEERDKWSWYQMPWYPTGPVRQIRKFLRLKEGQE
jgi:hypothetical protein